MLSIVHAQQVPPRGGETGFVDMQAARATLSPRRSGGNQIYGAFDPNRRVDLHAIDGDLLARGDVADFLTELDEPAPVHSTHRCAALPAQAALLKRAAKAAIARRKFARSKTFEAGDEEDFAMFPKVAVHPLLANHYVDSGPLLYVGSPHMKALRGGNAQGRGKG